MSSFRTPSLLVIGFCLAAVLVSVEAGRSLLATKHTLFVFGDSYVDDGNLPKAARNWAIPYGSSRPGSPTGRFSNGRVLSDFIAKLLRIRPPPPFNYLPQPPSASSIAHGLNFAEGGSGVFQGSPSLGFRNASDQIERFQQVLATGAFTAEQLSEAFVLFSISGNDYYAFVAIHGISNLTLFPPFIASVVNQMSMDITTLYELGLRKFILPNLVNVGCAPSNAILTNFTACVNSLTSLGALHNQLLAAAVEQLTVSLPGSSFLILDQFKAFNTIQADMPGFGFKQTWKPCCLGIGTQGNCGLYDSAGNALFTLCNAPKKSFYWDMSHPTDAGWKTVSSFYIKGTNFTAPLLNLPAFIAAY